MKQKGKELMEDYMRRSKMKLILGTGMIKCYLNYIWKAGKALEK